MAGLLICSLILATTFFALWVMERTERLFVKQSWREVCERYDDQSERFKESASRLNDANLKIVSLSERLESRCSSSVKKNEALLAITQAIADYVEGEESEDPVVDQIQDVVSESKKSWKTMGGVLKYGPNEVKFQGSEKYDG